MHTHILLQVHIMFSYTHVRGEPALERWLSISNGDSQLEVLYNLVGTFLLPKLLYVTTGLVTIIILFYFLSFSDELLHQQPTKSTTHNLSTLPCPQVTSLCQPPSRSVSRKGARARSIVASQTKTSLHGCRMSVLMPLSLTSTGHRSTL